MSERRAKEDYDRFCAAYPGEFKVWEALDEDARQRLIDAHTNPLCCERDSDGDGNCDIHKAPGVLR